MSQKPVRFYLVEVCTTRITCASMLFAYFCVARTLSFFFVEIIVSHAVKSNIKVLVSSGAIDFIICHFFSTPLSISKFMD